MIWKIEKSQKGWERSKSGEEKSKVSECRKMLKDSEKYGNMVKTGKKIDKKWKNRNK